VLALLGALGSASGAAAVVGAPVAAVVGAPPVGVSKYVPVAPARILDTRTGVGAPATRPASGASVQVQVTGRGGVPSTGVTAVTLNVVVTEPREVGYVQALPAGSGTLGASSNINIYYLGQTAGNLITVPVGANGAVTLYDVAGGNLIADVSGYFTAATASTDGRYVPLNPTRVVDSRDGTGLPPAPGSTPKPAAGQAFTVQGAGAGGVPAAGVSSVAMTVTATESTAAGFVQVVPTGGTTALGETSNVNLTGAGQTVANLVIVPVGTGGTFQLYSSSGTHLLVDVVGYFTDTTAAQADTGLFVPLDPARLLDTRDTSTPAAGSLTPFAPLGRANIPADRVSAVFLNPTATQTTGPGYLQLYPAGRGTVGDSSSLNYTASGQTIATATIAALGDGGVTTIFTPTRTQVIVDAFGYFTGPATPPARFSAYAWGSNAFDQLGAGVPLTDRLVTGKVGADTHWASIAAGGAHVLAVKTDASLWAWGDNEFGQLGDGTTKNRAAPTPVGADSSWAFASAGDRHSVAIKTDGTLWAWGDNFSGELGDGTTSTRSVPTRVGTDTRWASVSAGADYTLAVKTDGTLWAWGDNSTGELGDGTTTTRSVPTQVGTGTLWVSATAGYDHSVAVRTDRTLWAWGDNSAGQLGDGSTTSRLVPAQVGTDTGWASVAAGYQYTVAAKADGTLWTWGGNTSGQLGDGTTTPRSTPAQVGNGAGWASVAAPSANETTVAVKTDGTLWAWGNNYSGQLGDGTYSNRAAPAQVGADAGWASAAAGADFTVALRP
jgi:alpha-tubulin suppressor-like RCC1 family protein